MASPPFNINEAIPADADFVSQHPSGARTFRDVVESWLLINHNNLGQHFKVELASQSTPTGAAGVGVLWQESGVLKYRTAADAIDFTMDLGKLTLFPTGAVGLTLESTAATDIAAEFKGSGGSVFIGQGADETFAVKGDSNLDTAPWFSVNATGGAFAGTLAVTGALTAASLDLTTPLPVAEGGTGSGVAATALANLGGVSATNPTISGASLNGLTKIAPSASTLTIASGVITVTASRHLVETEGGTGSDDLVTINGGTDGALLILSAANGGHTVVIKTTGNISTIQGNDIDLDDLSDVVQFIYLAGNSKWNEIGRKPA